jgi:hypothetical protein
MKAYILTEKDFEDLLTAIDRDPKWGTQGGSSGVLSKAEEAAHEGAHRFYNYQLRTWINKVKQ